MRAKSSKGPAIHSMTIKSPCLLKPSNVIKIALLLAFALPAFGQITQSIVLATSQSASNPSVTACTSDCHYEVLLQNWGTVTVGATVFEAGGMNIIVCATCAGAGVPGIHAVWPQGSEGACVGNVYPVALSTFPSQNAYLRFQYSVAGSAYLPAKTSVTEILDALGNTLLSKTCTYTGLSGTPGAGATVRASSATTITVAFARGYSNNVRIGSQMPVTTPAGIYTANCIFHWKFDNSLADDCNSFNAALSGGSAAYTSTGTVQNLVVARPQFNPLFWTDWTPLKVGSVNTFTGVESFSQAAASSVPTAYAWTQNASASGCTRAETLSISNSTTSAPSVTPTVGPREFCIDLQITDTNGNMDTTTLKLGAVNYDRNGKVIPPSDGKPYTDFFGPRIAFGYNPWNYADRQACYAFASCGPNGVGAQVPYQAANNDFGWTTTGQGTISYPYAGIGAAPGQAGTTLCGTTSCNATTLTSSGLTLTVTDASKLPSLASLPTWLELSCSTCMGGGSFGAHPEVIRVTATTATTGNAVLTVGYDGRGLAGNSTAIGGYIDVLAAQSWLSDLTTIVGEFRISGTSTLFSTDSARAICPAGVPGPIGAVVTTAGTVTLTAGSTTVTGSGTGWTANNIGTDTYGGGWIRISATHASGTPFVFWAQLTAASLNVGAQTITMSRPAPIGVDGMTAFSYKITSHAMYPSFEFTNPTYSETARGLFNTIGCESETAAFALFTHDTTGLSATTVPAGSKKYSYKIGLAEISGNGTPDPNFYGSGGLAPREFYYVSGYGPALDLANSVDEYWVRDPMLGDGLYVGSALNWGGGTIGAMADLLFNASTVLTWANVESFAARGEIGSNACNAYDTRDGGYVTGVLSIAANWDTNSTPRSDFKTALASVLTRDQGCIRTFADGYRNEEVNSFGNSSVWSPSLTTTTQPLTLTNGSTTVTGSSFTNGIGASEPGGYCYGVNIITLTVTNGLSTATVASGTLSHQSFRDPSPNPSDPIMLYFYDGTTVGVFQYEGEGGAGTSVQLAGVWSGLGGTYSAMSTGGGAIISGGQRLGGYGGILAVADPNAVAPDNLANNQALKKIWACKYNSSSSLTLFRAWDQTSTSGLTGGKQYYIAYYNIGSFGQQPFMDGIKTNQMYWASKNDNSTIANGYAALLPLSGNWFNSYGWDANNAGHGTFYNSVAQACGSEADVPAGNFYSIHGYQGCGTSGLHSEAASIARTNSAEAGSTMIQYYLDSVGATRRAITDTFYGAVVGASGYCTSAVLSTCDGTVGDRLDDGALQGSKWPGFYFGMGGWFTNRWPAERLAGAPTITTTCPLTGGTQNTSYSQTLTATGETATWSISSGTLPTGLSLVGNAITGTPTGSGLSTFYIDATNAVGNATNGPLSCSITIAGAVGGVVMGGNAAFGGRFTR